MKALKELLFPDNLDDRYNNSFRFRLIQQVEVAIAGRSRIEIVSEIHSTGLSP